MNKLMKFAHNPGLLVLSLGHRGRLKGMGDARYLKLIYCIKMGKALNLDDPKTYSEKLQWLKLYNRNPLYVKLVDKYEVKKYIAEKIGSEYLIPILGVRDRFDDIDFQALPDQFVLKCTHDSGGLVICKDRSKFNRSAAAKINDCLKHRFFWGEQEWPYKDIKTRIIAETDMEELAAELFQGILHERVDFYEVDGKVYFGEVTFFHWSGMSTFEFESWDETFGSWIQLPNKGKIRA